MDQHSGSAIIGKQKMQRIAVKKRDLKSFENQESLLSHGWALEHCKYIDYLKTLQHGICCHLGRTRSIPKHACIAVWRRKEPWKDVTTRWLQTCSSITCCGQPPGRHTTSTFLEVDDFDSDHWMHNFKQTWSGEVWTVERYTAHKRHPLHLRQLGGNPTMAVVGFSKIARTTPSVRGLYIATVQYSSLCVSAVVLILGGSDVMDVDEQDREQVDSEREMVEAREREKEDKTRTSNTRSNMWHHGWHADGVNAH